MRLIRLSSFMSDSSRIAGLPRAAALCCLGGAVGLQTSCGPVASSGPEASPASSGLTEDDLAGLSPDEALIAKALARNAALAEEQASKIDDPSVDPAAESPALESQKADLASMSFDPVPIGDPPPKARPAEVASSDQRRARAIEWSDGSSGRAAGGSPRVIAAPPPSASGNNAWKLDDIMPLGQAGGSTPARDTPALTTPPPARLDALLQDLSGRLTKEAAGSDMPARELMLIAATSLVDPEHQLNVDQFTDLTEREREVLVAWHEFYRDLGKELASVGDVDAVMPAAIDRLRARLSGEPLLTLPHAALCTKVDGFGAFQTFSSNQFRARQAQPVVVYVEVDHFDSETDASGRWVTRLKQEIEIYRGDESRPIHAARPQPFEDVAQVQREDFFLATVFTIPDALSIDYYAMKVRVTDELSGEVAETTIDFRIVN